MSNEEKYTHPGVSTEMVFFQPQSEYTQAVCCGAGHLTSLCLRFLICEIRTWGQIKALSALRFWFYDCPSNSEKYNIVFNTACLFNEAKFF